MAISMLRTSAASLAVLSCGCAASAQTVVLRHVRPGGGFSIGMSMLDAQCRPQRSLSVFISAPPLHGRLTLSRGMDVQRDHPNPACNFRPAPAVFVRYSAPAAFAGQDRFSIGCRPSPPSDCRPFTVIVTIGP